MIGLTGREVLAHLKPALTTTDMGVSKMADHKIDGNYGAGNVQAPERIWASNRTNGNCVVSFTSRSEEYSIEYIRADVAASQLAAANARDDALGEAAKEAHAFAAENQWHPSSVTSLVTRILALRDKPAPGLTPKIEVKFTWVKGDEEFWVHLKSPDGKSAGFNLGNPKGMIATALLRAIAGGD